MRHWRSAAILLTGIVLLAVVAVGASATLDAPSRTLVTQNVIDAPRETVWRFVSEFDEYGRWNPIVTAASGTARVGTDLDLHFEYSDGSADDVDARVSIVKLRRKIRWQTRLVVPGLLDREYEVIVEPLGGDRARVTQRERFEGVLALLVDVDREAAALEEIGAALAVASAEAAAGEG